MEQALAERASLAIGLQGTQHQHQQHSGSSTPSEEAAALATFGAAMAAAGLTNSRD
jgi:hypothetical protein